MEEFRIGPLKSGEELEAYRLVQAVFDEFVAPGYTVQGNAFFHDFIEPIKIADRRSKGNLFLTARNMEKIVGVIEVRDNFHICLFFVDTKFQGKGIGKKLFATATSICRARDAGITFFEVNASPYSEKIYSRLGFQKESEMQEINGMKFVPMRMKVLQ